MIRKVLFRDEHFWRIREEEEKWLNRGLETGGYLFGRLHPNMVAEITFVTDGGPKAVRTPASYTGDNEYATKKKEELQKGK